MDKSDVQETRDECLNENWFSSLADAREKIGQWRQDYNEARPHSRDQSQSDRPRNAQAKELFCGLL